MFFRGPTWGPYRGGEGFLEAIEAFKKYWWPHISLVPSLRSRNKWSTWDPYRGGGGSWFTLHPTLTNVSKEAKALNLLSNAL